MTNLGTGLDRPVLQVQGPVDWGTGSNLRTFPIPVPTLLTAVITSMHDIDMIYAHAGCIEDVDAYSLYIQSTEGSLEIPLGSS